MDQEHSEKQVQLALRAIKLEAEGIILRNLGFEDEAKGRQQKAQEFAAVAGREYGETAVFINKAMAKRRFRLFPWMISTEMH